MKRRPRRVVPAVLAGLALVAVCVLVAVSAIQMLSGTKELISYDRVAARLHAVSWGNGWVLGAGVATVLIGLLLLAPALLPGRSLLVPLESENGYRAGILRGSLRAAVRDAAETVKGLESARIRLGKNKIRVIARTAMAPEQVSGAARAGIEERLKTMGLGERHDVLARVRGKR